MNFTLPKVPSSLSLSLGYTEARSLIFTIAKKLMRGETGIRGSPKQAAQRDWSRIFVLHNLIG